MRHLALINGCIAVTLNAINKKMAEDQIRSSCSFITDLSIYDELDTANSHTTCKLGEGIFRRQTLSLDELIDWNDHLYEAKQTAAEADQAYTAVTERLQKAREELQQIRREMRDTREDRVSAYKQVECWENALGYHPGAEESSLPKAQESTQESFNERDYYDEES